MKRIKQLILKNSITKNTSALYLLNGFNFLLSIILIPELIKDYGLKDWGEIIFIQIIINYFVWIIEWSFPQYACKLISINEDKEKKRSFIFNITRTSQLILFIFCSTIIVIFGILFSISKMICIFSILILFGSFLQPYWYLNGREKIYETALFQLLNKLLLAIFVFSIINANSEIYIYFLFFGISNLITGILCNLLIIFKYKEVIKFVKFSQSIRIIKKSSHLFLASLIGNLTNSSIPFILGSFYSLEFVGIYNIAERIKNIAIQIINPLNNAMFPRMSKYNNQNKKLAIKNFNNFVCLILILGIFVFIILNFNINYIVEFFAKETNNQINITLKILSISFLLNIIYETFINQYLIINNMYKEINKIKIIILFSSILLGFPLINQYGIYGASLTSLLYESIGLMCAINIFINTKNKSSFLNSK